MCLEELSRVPRLQVLALCTCPSMLDDPAIVAAMPADVVARAKRILGGTHGLGKPPCHISVVAGCLPRCAQQVTAGRSLTQTRGHDADTTGAYSDSRGIDAARESVKAYIEERDGFPTDLDDIFLTNGASEGSSALTCALVLTVARHRPHPRGSMEHVMAIGTVGPVVSSPTIA